MKKIVLLLAGAFCLMAIACTTAVRAVEQSSQEQWLSNTAMSIALGADKACTSTSDTSCVQRVIHSDATKISGLSEAQTSSGLSEANLMTALAEQATHDVHAFYM